MLGSFPGVMSQRGSPIIALQVIRAGLYHSLAPLVALDWNSDGTE